MSMMEQDFAQDLDEWEGGEHGCRPPPHTCYPPAWPGRDRPGATDGQPARPGMVGEFVSRSTSSTYAAGTQTQVVSALVLPAGDWDIQISLLISAATSAVSVTEAGIRLDPIPAGMTDPLWTPMVGSEVATDVLLASSRAQGLFAVPTLLSVNVQTTSPTGGGNWTLTATARRMR